METRLAGLLLLIGVKNEGGRNIMSIAQKLEYLNQTKTLIREALNNKGANIKNADTFRSWVNKINNLPSGGGTNPPPTPTPDNYVRPEAPIGTSMNDNEIFMLFAVKENVPNDYAVLFTTDSANDGSGYEADWGDGVIEHYATNTKCQHIFDYDTLSIEPTDEGIKWVWVKFVTVHASIV
jgi:hypothetical protein